VGRNGIFYDRKGNDWDATIVRIVDHPISIRQAFWSPYKKLVRFINDQLRKLAAARAAAADAKLIQTAVATATPVAAGTPPPPPKAPFDVGKFAGIFAAIGLALGAIGGVLASVIGGILGLKLWQIPLAILGIILLISGPAMIVAWFKLKKRNLGPMLDANGWAINSRALINISFGTSLTKLARLPEGSNRSLTDPYADKKPVWPYYLIIAGVVVAVILLWLMGLFDGS
jgi:MFS family permease